MIFTINIRLGESVNRRRIDNTIKEQTMIYKTLHRKLKIEQHELLKTVGLRCSRKVSSSYCIAACEILRFPSEIYRQYTYIVDKYIICLTFRLLISILFNHFEDYISSGIQHINNRILM
jgi:hypothetical protein